MRIYSVQEMRQRDKTAVEHGCPLEELMERAGQGVAETAKRLCLENGFTRLHFLVGKGNNGGDALVSCRLLLREGWRVALTLAEPPENFGSAAAAEWEKLPIETRAAVQVADFSITESEIRKTLMVDGLLGTACRGDLRHPYDFLIQKMNSLPIPVLAIDIPSGLNADTGEGNAVRADFTVTIDAPKIGMFRENGPKYCGRVTVHPIGLPLDEAGQPQAFTLESLRRRWFKEEGDTHKYRRGTVAVLGGSPSYPSAPFLTGEAALRTGTGLVSVYFPEKAPVFCAVPRALIVRMPQGQQMSVDEYQQILGGLKKSSVLAVGPGLGQSVASQEAVQLALKTPVPQVVDADALNLLALHPEWLETAPAVPRIFTPHAGELARLALGLGISQTQSLEEQARELARRTGAVVLLKGHFSCICTPDGDWGYNLTGAATLATAGSGDVLTGMIAALLAQGLEPPCAARLGACLHGLCGELARPAGSRGVLADDLLPLIPQAICHISPIF